MNETGILLADLGEILKFLIVVVIIGFSIISKLLNSKAEAQGQRRPNPPAPRPAPRPGAPAGERAQPQSIEQEIETFLRQARGEKRGAAPPRQGPPGRPAPPRPPVVAEAVTVSEAAEPRREFGRGVASPVKEHRGSKPMGEATAHLGDQIEAADERVEHHLEEVFGHELGHLSHLDEPENSIDQGTDAAIWEQDRAPDTSATGIAKLLRSPEDVRQVFVLSEILNRPEF